MLEKCTLSVLSHVHCPHKVYNVIVHIGAVDVSLEYYTCFLMASVVQNILQKHSTPGLNSVMGLRCTVHWFFDLLCKCKMFFNYSSLHKQSCDMICQIDTSWTTVHVHCILELPSSVNQADHFSLKVCTHKEAVHAWSTPRHVPPMYSRGAKQLSWLILIKCL